MAPSPLLLPYFLLLYYGDYSGIQLNQLKKFFTDALRPMEF